MFDKIKDIVSDITGGGDLGDLNLGGVEKYLDGITFPIDKAELKTALQNNGVPDQVLGVVDKLPNKVFESQDDLVSNLGSVAGAAGLGDLAGKAGDAADSAKGAADDAAAKADDAKSAASDARDAADNLKGDLKKQL
jgi:hypothetical protein